MAELKIFKFKLSIKYLLFIILVIIGCFYQIIEVSQVYFKFETKVDVKYEQNNEIAIPMVSFCKPTSIMFRNSSQQINGLSPAQVYNMTFGFADVFIRIDFIRSNGKFSRIVKFKNEDQINSEIHYEKSISNWTICYHFKYLHLKQLKRKKAKIYLFTLYHYSYETSSSYFNNYPYRLYFTSDVNYPSHQKDYPILIFGNNFFLKKIITNN